MGVAYLLRALAQQQERLPLKQRLEATFLS